MYQQDYILRIIEQLGVLLRRMRKALREQRPEEAVDASTEALGLVLDTDPRVADSLTAESLVALLGAGGQLDTRRCLALGEVFTMRAAALRDVGREQAAAAAGHKAYVVLNAVIDHEPDGEAARRAEELLGQLE